MLSIKVLWLILLSVLLCDLSYAQPAKLDEAKSPPPHAGNQSKHAKEVRESRKTIEPAPSVVSPNINVTIGGKLELFSYPKEADAPEKQENRFSEFFNAKITDWVIAIFTVVLACYTIRLSIATVSLVGISRKQDTSTRMVERAYVRMSHSPAGVILNQIESKCAFTVQMHVKNYGNTPARVTNIGLFYQLFSKGDPIPSEPAYQPLTPEERRNLFLVRNEETFLPWLNKILDNTTEDALKNGDDTLWIYAYIDYIDAFGDRYRGGYAVYFNHEMTELDVDNLALVTQPGYNYDRKRNPGEGNDWNNPL